MTRIQPQGTGRPAEIEEIDATSWRQHGLVFQLQPMGLLDGVQSIHLVEDGVVKADHSFGVVFPPSDKALCGPEFYLGYTATGNLYRAAKSAVHAAALILAEVL